MKYAERLSKRGTASRGYHSAIVTSFAIEFAGFEEVMLPQLAAAGATNVLLVADERMSAIALSDGTMLPRQLGRDYVLHGPAQQAGVFHPKIVLQLGRDGGRAFVGSANATASGMGGNLEIVTEVSCGTEASPEQDFVRAVWRYLENVAGDAGGAAGDAIRWARGRSPWLAGPSPQPVQTLSDGTLLALLARPAVEGMATSFVQLVGVPVDRLVVMSPYFDEDLRALKELSGRLAGRTTTVVVDPDSHGLPDDPAVLEGLELVDASQWLRGKGRFKHAKLIIAQTADHDHILAGSANCTVPALGHEGFGGSNSEASVYRRVPRGEALKALDLLDLLEDPRIETSDLAPVKRSEPIALEAAREARPGRFEAEHGELRWIPAGREWKGRLQLLNAERLELGGIPIAEMDVMGDARTARLDSLADVRFVRIEDGDVRSTVAPLMHRGILKARRREAPTRSIAAAASSFVDRDDLQLFLLQALDELQRADVEEAQPGARGRSRGEGESQEKRGAPVEVLPYERFIEQKPQARRPTGGESSVAGMHSDGVRALLNRLSGAQAVTDERPAAGSDWMELGDEDEQRTLTVDIVEVAATERPPADRSAFVKAVKRYERSMAGGPDSRPVLGLDVLRLRFWLLLLLHAARRPGYERGLPCTTDEWGWPRLVVRVLSVFFYPNQAPVARLVLEGGYLDMPIDFLEAWATALWCLDAVSEALSGSRGSGDFLSRLPMLRKRMVERIGLTAAEIDGPAATQVRLGLDQEFGALKGGAA